MNSSEKHHGSKVVDKTDETQTPSPVPNEPDQTLTIQQAIDLGLTHHRTGDLAKASNIYQQILAAKPEQPVVLNLLGVIALQIGKPDNALSLLEKSLTIDPDVAEVHSNLGIAFLDLEKPFEAFTCQRRAVTLDPENDVFWGRVADAIKYLSFTSIDTDLLHDLLLLLNRPDISPFDVVRPVISALYHHPEFAHILELTSSSTRHTAINYQSTAAQLSAIPLFVRLIALTHLPDLKIERMLTLLRSSMLQETINGTVSDTGLIFSSALALHCFANEYVFPETHQEKHSIEQLQTRIAALLEQNSDVPPSLIVALGAYRPLYQFTWAQQLTEVEWDNEFSALIERQISEPLREASLRAHIPCLTRVRNTISKSVREQYEESPYPRWARTTLTNDRLSIGETLKAAPLYYDLGDYQTPREPKILIAGCGTGQHAVYTACRFKDVQVLAVDLSLSSLSYAKRKSNEFGISNIEYAQADILELGSLDQRFDLIECSGVLHHMDDPLAGWKALLDLLKPGGLFRIGLYSEAARQHIVAGRSHIADMGYTSSPDDIRKCRQDLIAIANNGDSVLNRISTGRDFFSLSACRDLLFHVQEHRFTIPQIKSALNRLNLKFIGFEFGYLNTLQDFKATYPNESDPSSLDLWHAFEQENPDTFAGMYQFWCRKI